MKRLSIVFVFYVLLAGLALYRPILHLDTHLPGTTAFVTDFFHFHWNYWWLGHALTTPGLHVYETNYVMAPYTTNLAYHTVTPGWFPIWALVEPIAGNIAAMTVIMLTAMALAGSALFALLRHEGSSPGLALTGGAMLTLSSMMLNGVFGTNVNLMGWFWIPALVLLWNRLVQANQRVVGEGGANGRAPGFGPWGGRRSLPWRCGACCWWTCNTACLPPGLSCPMAC